MEHSINQGRAKRGLIAALGCVLVAGVLLASPSRGDARSLAPDKAVAPTPTTAVAHRLDPTGVRDYWTAARMEAAVPLALDEVGKLIAPRTKGTSRTSARAALRAPRSTGKLFFTTPQGDAVCSAAAVNTAKKNLIITAAHCAYGAGGLLSGSDYFTRFLFVPRYNNGTGPDGRWTGTRAITHQQWIDSENLDFDQAVIEVAPITGRKLVNVVGGNGLAWNYPARQRDMRLWGWPAEAPYDGETVKSCGGDTADLDGNGDAFLSCPLNGGASGGPWFIGMINPNVGYIWAVTSRRTTSGPPFLLAHPFKNSIKNLLTAARGSRVAARQAPRVAAEQAPREAVRQGIAFRAVQAQIGRGQVLTLRARTARNLRIVLDERFANRGPWRRTLVKRTNSAGEVEFKKRMTRVGLHTFRVRTARGTSATVRVRVFACPLPANRNAAVVKATACTAPVG